MIDLIFLAEAIKEQNNVIEKLYSGVKNEGLKFSVLPVCVFCREDANVVEVGEV